MIAAACVERNASPSNFHDESTQDSRSIPSRGKPGAKGRWAWEQDSIVDRYLAVIGPVAYAVLGVLRRHEYGPSNEATISRQAIAAKIGMSVDSVDRAIKILVTHQLVEVNTRHGAAGAKLASTYRLLAVDGSFGDRPDRTDPSRTQAATLAAPKRHHHLQTQSKQNDHDVSEQRPMSPGPAKQHANQTTIRNSRVQAARPVIPSNTLPEHLTNVEELRRLRAFSESAGLRITEFDYFAIACRAVARAKRNAVGLFRRMLVQVHPASQISIEDENAARQLVRRQLEFNLDPSDN